MPSGARRARSWDGKVGTRRSLVTPYCHVRRRISSFVPVLASSSRTLVRASQRAGAHSWGAASRARGGCERAERDDGRGRAFATTDLDLVHRASPEVPGRPNPRGDARRRLVLILTIVALIPLIAISLREANERVDDMVLTVPILNLSAPYSQVLNGEHCREELGVRRARHLDARAAPGLISTVCLARSRLLLPLHILSIGSLTGCVCLVRSPEVAMRRCVRGQRLGSTREGARLLVDGRPFRHGRPGAHTTGFGAPFCAALRHLGPRMARDHGGRGRPALSKRPPPRVRALTSALALLAPASARVRAPPRRPPPPPLPQPQQQPQQQPSRAPGKGGGGAPRARARSGDPPRVMQVCSAGVRARSLHTVAGNEKSALLNSYVQICTRSSVSFRFNLNLFERCVPRNRSCQSKAAHFTVHVMIRYFRHSWRARLGAAEARHGGGAAGRGDTSRAQEGVRAASSARGRPGGGSRRARRQPSVQLLQQTHSRARRACHRLNRHRRPRSAWRRYSSS